MSSTSTAEITGLLVAWGNGDEAALEKLTPLVYDELHRLAKRRMARERPGHTLQTTALVNEAFLRLIDWKNVRWQDRAHFFGVSAQLMRHILVRFALERRQARRGGQMHRVSLDEAAAVVPEQSLDLIALDEALGRLAALDERQSRVVELRFFAGLSIEETAEVLKVSPITVRRDWSLATDWSRCLISASPS
ncbi:MAG: sigma-70 family RNA polymerase sigma factor [Blastocatellia bacterium]